MNTAAIPSHRTSDMPFERLIFLEAIPDPSNEGVERHEAELTSIFGFDPRSDPDLSEWFPPKEFSSSGPTSRPRGGHGEPVCSRGRLLDAAACWPGTSSGGTGPPETMPKPCVNGMPRTPSNDASTATVSERYASAPQIGWGSDARGFNSRLA